MLHSNGITKEKFCIDMESDETSQAAKENTKKILLKIKHWLVAHDHNQMNLSILKEFTRNSYTLQNKDFSGIANSIKIINKNNEQMQFNALENSFKELLENENLTIPQNITDVIKGFSQLPSYLFKDILTYYLKKALKEYINKKKPFNETMNKEILNLNFIVGPKDQNDNINIAEQQIENTQSINTIKIFNGIDIEYIGEAPTGTVIYKPVQLTQILDGYNDLKESIKENIDNFEIWGSQFLKITTTNEPLYNLLHNGDEKGFINYLSNTFIEKIIKKYKIKETKYKRNEIKKEFMRAFLKTYPPASYDYITQKPQSKANKRVFLNYLNHPLTYISSFLGLPNRLGDNHWSLGQLMKNFIGWQDNASTNRAIFNIIKTPFAIVWHTINSITKLAINIVKLVTEFIPHTVVNLLNLAKNRSKNKIAKGIITLASVPFRVWGFVGRAITSPFESIRAHLHEIKTQKKIFPNKIWAGFKLVSSALITGAAYTAAALYLLPLAAKIIVAKAVAHAPAIATIAKTASTAIATAAKSIISHLTLETGIAAGAAALVTTVGLAIERGINRFKNWWHQSKMPCNKVKKNVEEEGNKQPPKLNNSLKIPYNNVPGKDLPQPTFQVQPNKPNFFSSNSTGENSGNEPIPPSTQHGSQFLSNN